jgi:hypothetical protein
MPQTVNITAAEYNDILERQDYTLSTLLKPLKKLREGNTNGMGLISDAVKFSPEYIDAKRAYDKAKNRFRQFNKLVPKKIKREASELSRAKKWKGYK